MRGVSKERISIDSVPPMDVAGISEKILLMQCSENEVNTLGNFSHGLLTKLFIS